MKNASFYVMTFKNINNFSVFGAKQSGTLKAVKAGEITEEELTEIGLKHGAPPVQLSGNYYCFHIGSMEPEPEQKIRLLGPASVNVSLM